MRTDISTARLITPHQELRYGLRMHIFNGSNADFVKIREERTERFPRCLRFTVVEFRKSFEIFHYQISKSPRGFDHILIVPVLAIVSTGLEVESVDRLTLGPSKKILTTAATTPQKSIALRSPPYLPTVSAGSAAARSSSSTRRTCL